MPHEWHLGDAIWGIKSVLKTVESTSETVYNLVEYSQERKNASNKDKESQNE